MLVVAALGGNAMLKRGQPLTAEAQRSKREGGGKGLGRDGARRSLSCHHSRNGPQVGLLALQGAAYNRRKPIRLMSSVLKPRG